MLRVLWEYLNRDFSDAKNERARLFPKGHERHQLRVTPWVQRVTRDLATMWREDPTRTATGIEEETWAAYEAELESADAAGDLDLQVINDHAIAMCQGYALVLPAPERAGVRLLPIAPHQIWFELDDPTRSDPANVKSVTFDIHENDGLMRRTSRAVITRTTAEWTDGPRKGESFFEGTGGVNPIGVVPILALRATAPPAGSFMAFAPEDQLQAQRAQDRAWTSLLHVGDTQGFSQPVLTLDDIGTDVEEREIGPETALKLRIGESFAYATPIPDLVGYLAQLKAYIETETAMVGLSPSSFLKSSAITGIARLVEMWDRSQERKHLEKQGRRLEQRLYELTALWCNYQLGRAMFPVRGVKVAVNFVYAQPPMDPSHEQQAAEGWVAMGVDSLLDLIMERKGLQSRTAARDFLMDNLGLLAAAKAANGAPPPSEAPAPAPAAA